MTSAVVLAAGRGSRAWPYSGIRQKVTLPVLNVPLVRRLVLDLLAAGVDEVVTVLGHRGAAVRSCLIDLPKVRFVEQRLPSGTADAALAGLEVVSNEDVLVAYGDVLIAQNEVKRLLEDHVSKSAQATLMVAHHLPSATLAYSVQVQSGGTVAGLQAATAGNTMGFFFAGMMIAARERLRYYLLKNPGVITNIGIGGMPPAEAELCCSLNMMARETDQVCFMLSKQRVVDVDKPWQLVEANILAGQWAMAGIEQDVTLGEDAKISDKAVIRDGVKLVLGKGASVGDYCKIWSSVVLADGARLGHGAMVRDDGPVFLGENSSVNDYAYVGGHSILGPRTYIGHGADFIGITFDDVSVRHAAQLCVVAGSKVNIAGGVMTGNWRFDNGIKTQVVDKCREIPERFGELTYIGDYVRTGNNVVFSPGTRVGSYSCIGPGVYVNQDVPDGKLVMQKQEVVLSDWGPGIYGW